MSPTKIELSEFRIGYRKLISQCVARADMRRFVWFAWREALLASPLAASKAFSPAELQAFERTFLELTAKIPARERAAYEKAAREILKELLPALPARDIHPESTSTGFGTGYGSEGGEDSAAGEDDTFIERGIGSAAPSPPSAAPRERASGAIAMRPRPEESDGGLLGGGAPPPPVEPPAVAEETPAPAPEIRYLAAEIADRDRNAPLEVGRGYVFSVFINVDESGDGSARFPDANVTHAPGEEVIELTIQVTSDDFIVAQDALPLKLPRRGPSLGKARFDITPKRAGPGTLTVNVDKQGNFLEQLMVSYSIGIVIPALPAPRATGRALSAAGQLKKRELGMTISPVVGGYECTVRGPTYTKVILPVTEAAVADAVATARAALLAVVKMRDDNARLVFQGSKPIAADVQEKALRVLACAGAALFRALFYGPAAGADVQGIGDLLRRLATRPDRRLELQVVATRFPVPWGLLYMGSDSDDATIDWELFLGMRHVIEQIPLQAVPRIEDAVIVSDEPGLTVSVNMNAGIDAQFKLDVVARHLAFWNAAAAVAGPRLRYTMRTTRKEIQGALKGRVADQLMYLYCHAVTNTPGDPGGIKGSHLVFTNNERLSLDDLDREAPMTDTLPGNPLVFINACESAKLRPEFYDGFIPYFMAKGARGVVGTECETPAVFATDWALAFFPRFLGGEPLGELFLDLRRQFWNSRGSPLGLLYNVYCDGDTQVEPGLTL